MLKLLSGQRACFPGGGKLSLGYWLQLHPSCLHHWKGHIPFGYCCLMEFHSQEEKTRDKSNLYQRPDPYRWKITRCIWKHKCNIERSQPASSQGFMLSTTGHSLCYGKMTFLFLWHFTCWYTDVDTQMLIHWLWQKLSVLLLALWL